MTTGHVTETVGGAYTVATPKGSVQASLRGRLKASGRETDKVVIGDRVTVRADRGGGHVIEKVHPRQTTLARRKTGGRVAKVVAANLERLLVVMSVADPPASREVIDRMLVMGESGGLQPHLVLTKGDLAAGRVTGEALAEAYKAVGYPVLMTSVVTGEGKAAFQELIEMGSSALIGPSGVGKSSLLNWIAPLKLRTREVGRRSRTGKHTTVSSRLIPLSGGGQVADTPGFSDVGLGEVATADLDGCFLDFRPFLGRCHFRDCAHIHEPACSVREALGDGQIQPERYRSYCAIREELAGG